jgi:hypothetical protein
MSQKNVKKDIVSEMSALKNLLQNYDNNEILSESDDLLKISKTILNTNDVSELSRIIANLEAGRVGQSFGKVITGITQHFYPERKYLIHLAKEKIEKIKQNNLPGVEYQSKQ